MSASNAHTSSVVHSEQPASSCPSLLIRRCNTKEAVRKYKRHRPPLGRPRVSDPPRDPRLRKALSKVSEVQKYRKKFGSYPPVESILYEKETDS